MLLIVLCGQSKRNPASEREDPGPLRSCPGLEPLADIKPGPLWVSVCDSCKAERGLSVLRRLQRKHTYTLI